MVVKSGILGLGTVARVRHVDAYRRDGRCEVVAAYDPDPSKQALATQLKIPFFTTNLDTFWGQQTDLVSICSPPAAHKSNAIEALQNGRHVLLEKPMALSVAEGQELTRAAESSGKKLCLVHNFLWSRSLAVAKAALTSGKVGEVTGVTAVQWSSWNRDLPSWHPTLTGGLFFDEVPHFIYLMEHLLGPLSVESAWSKQGGVRGDGREIRVDATLRGDKGFGSLSAWFGAPTSEWVVAIGCTRGSIVLDLFRDIAVVLPPEDKRDYRYILEVPTRATWQRWRRIGQWIGTRVFRGRHLYGHEPLVSAFLDSVVNDTEVPVSPQEGLRVMAVTEALMGAAGL